MSENELEPIQIPEQLQELAQRDAQLALGVSYVLQGDTYELAAQKSGYKSRTALWQKGNAWVALLKQEERADAIARDVFRVAQLAIGETAQNILDGEVSPQQMPIVAGIFTDKFVKLEELKIKREQGTSSLPNAAAQLMAKLHEQGGGTATISVEVTTNEPTTLDVEAEEA